MSSTLDIVVVGGGHAGIEAALAAARMGAQAALVTLDAKAIGRMSCNPAIGGLGKGQMVREIDALGGEMGKGTDAAGIQFRMLNTRKGPAVQAPRAQCDKHAYQDNMVRVCSSTPGLAVIEGKVEELLIEPVGSGGIGATASHRLLGVKLADGSEIRSRAVILTNGTFLRGLMHCGFDQTRGGRVGEDAAYGLSPFLERLGFERGRLKTGTPPRVEASSVDWSLTTPQPGDDPPVPFSHFTDRIPLPQVPCHIAYTNDATHAAIRENLHRSPMYSGVIEGIGPRYCPSIEDKVVRFAEKERHQIFLEPEGLSTSWIYLNGISTSLPRDVQDRIVASIPALERAKILQYGYAVEYDFFPPTQIRATFETKRVDGLYFAGQICGTSGYEEAAGQGFLAGVNAVLKLRDGDPLVLDRSQAYLGVLVDDLVVECPREPYRMFTSRAEYRLLLRSDNADQRLMEIGHGLGLIGSAAMARLEKKRRAIRDAFRYLETHHHDGKDLLRLLRQPGSSYADVAALDAGLGALSLDPDEAGAVEVDAKYAAYIERQNAQVEKWKRMERRLIPDAFDYSGVKGIRAESKEKLTKVRPRSVGQASRIAGVTPADLGVLLVYLDAPLRGRKGAS
jgi:tRNA uridine 5-carboxymethylaminomethyl modification enzyme